MLTPQIPTTARAPSSGTAAPGGKISFFMAATARRLILHQVSQPDNAAGETLEGLQTQRFGLAPGVALLGVEDRWRSNRSVGDGDHDVADLIDEGRFQERAPHDAAAVDA